MSRRVTETTSSTRLERGRVSVAVEFCAGEDTPAHAVIPLVAVAGRAHCVAMDAWGDIHDAPPDENG